MLGDRIIIFITQDNGEYYFNRRIGINDVKRIAIKDINIYVCGSKAFISDYKEHLEKTFTLEFIRTNGSDENETSNFSRWLWQSIR